MKRILNTKLKKFGAFSILASLGLYQTGYLEDTYYLLGGMWRGLRCAGVGFQIMNKYVSVKFELILERNK